ncbi:MAG: hypothetical protein HYU36_11660 [Planctomycetes bacterium]|nr:hypothetical protein [Planctomycetota bacterium]
MPTLGEGRVELPLERVAGEGGLCEFEKFLLALVLAPTLDNEFRLALERLADTSCVEISTAMDLLCDSLEEKVRSRRFFTYQGSLSARGLLNVVLRAAFEAAERETAISHELLERCARAEWRPEVRRMAGFLGASCEER